MPLVNKAIVVVYDFANKTLRSNTENAFLNIRTTTYKENSSNDWNNNGILKFIEAILQLAIQLSQLRTYKKNFENNLAINSTINFIQYLRSTEKSAYFTIVDIGIMIWIKL